MSTHARDADAESRGRARASVRQLRPPRPSGAPPYLGGRGIGVSELRVGHGGTGRVARGGTGAARPLLWGGGLLGAGGRSRRTG